MPVTAVSKKEKSHAELLGQYWTDDALAKRVVEWADVRPGSYVLEPSVGGGAFYRHFPGECEATLCEIDPDVAAALRPGVMPGDTLIVGDFLERDFGPNRFDLAIMNPPFDGGQDGLHVAHALGCCARVVALVRANFMLGSRRYKRVHATHRVAREAILVNRPKFSGPADKGMGARSDHIVVELAPRLGRGPDKVLREFWAV